MAFEGLGAIAPWLVKRDARVTFTRFDKDAGLPSPNDIDLIVAVGSPMIVNDEAERPWLVDEKRFIAEAIEQRIAVLGICLGAQLIASARGGASTRASVAGSRIVLLAPTFATVVCCVRSASARGRLARLASPTAS